MQHSWRGLRPWKRHSLVLLVAGLVYIAIGVSYIVAEPTPSREIALHVILKWADLPFWGFVFIFAGLLSILSSRWPPISKTWGYTVLTGISGAWAAAYWTGILFTGSPNTNYSGVLTWGLMGFLWWGISGLVDPEHPVPLNTDLEV